MTTSGTSSAAARVGGSLVAFAVTLTAAAIVVAVRYQRNGVGAAVSILLLLCLSLTVVAAAIIRSQPKNPVGWLLAGAGLALPLAAGAALYAHAGYAASPELTGTRWAAWLDDWPWTFALTSVPLLGLLLFPTGRPPSGRLRPLLWACLVVLLLQLLSELFGTHLLDFPNRPNPTALPGRAGEVMEALGASIVAVPVLTTVNAWVLRRRRRAAPQDGALVLASRAAWAIAASWWLCVVAVAVTNDSNDALPAEALALVVLATACWVAIHRYGYFDTRQVVTRGLLYASLSGCVIVVYVAVAAAGTWLVSGSVGRPLGVVTAVLVALPLRATLQAWGNRLVYGDRNDPHAALDRLGRRLEDAAASSEVVPAVVHSVREALRLPFVRLDVSGASVSEGNRGPGGSETFPLVFAGEHIGELTVDHRDEGTPLTSSERALLTRVARQAAAAGYAASLTEALLLSRERLVVAREEERRRLRRDLHDGLGPGLAGIVLGLHRVGRRLDLDPREAAAQLEELTRQAQDAVADVRRLVYGLRPPALDELGLVAALTEQARTFDRVIVSESPPGSVPELPAAAEVAAYRIAMEAMTNSARHAQATWTAVTISVNGHLEVEIADDGIGVAADARQGVGLASMRERAAELGGRCEISARAPTGTLVRAVIPIGPR